MTKELNKAEVKAKWLEELRSGKHKQVKHTLVEKLEDGTLGYCCLGVLQTKVLGNRVSSQKRDEDGNIHEGGNKFYAQCRNILGKWKFSGYLDKEEYTRDGIERLTSLNDDREFNFNQIADEIEKRWIVE